MNKKANLKQDLKAQPLQNPLKFWVKLPKTKEFVDFQGVV